MTNWHEIADLETAKGEILTSTRTGGPWADTVAGLEALHLVDRPWSSALDFGCGVGRNIPGLLANGATVTGYDFPNMVRMARKYLGEAWERVTWIEPPIDNLRGLKVDLVIACLVFQHIPPADLDIALPLLRDMLLPDGRLYVTSRGWTDHGHVNVWPYVLRWFTPVTPLDDRMDETLHQLVVFRPREPAGGGA